MDPSTLKILQGAAGAAGDSTIGVEDVFKNYLYNGNSTARNITTNVDMSGGGMVWIKARSHSYDHFIADTERGALKRLRSNSAAKENTTTATVTGFNNDGFALGNDSSDWITNYSGREYVSWSLKKQEKFFTIKTYSGTGSNRTVSHDLGSVPGFIIIKSIDEDYDWLVYHRSVGATKGLFLNATYGADDQITYFNDTEPTSTEISLGSSNEGNKSGDNYIMYLFAHEEAEFGPNSDQKIISCGSYSGNGSSTGPEINIGFEPQWLMVKRTDSSASWVIIDSMRGIATGGDDQKIWPNGNWSETNADYADLTSTGFKLKTTHSEGNASGGSYIYVAIAAETGKTMKAIETGSDVFTTVVGTSDSSLPAFPSGFITDFNIRTQPGSVQNNLTAARLTGHQYLYTNATDDEDTASPDQGHDYNTGFGNWTSDLSSWQSWLWKRHAGFDVMTPTTTGSGYQFLYHNLGAVPEMMWMKQRDGTGDWHVYHKDLNGGTTPYNWSLHLNDNSAEWESGGNMWGLSNLPDKNSVIILDSYFGGAGDYLLLLFASVDGISKVGSYTSSGHGGSGSGGAVTVTTGFSPRFILIKNVSTGSGSRANWHVFDTTRGLTSGNNDPKLYLNTTAAQANEDWIDPTSTGFTLEANIGNDLIYTSGDKYIYYAHA
jgi:hypothetical protein